MAFYKSQDEFDRKKKERAKCRNDPTRTKERCESCSMSQTCFTEGHKEYLTP